MLTLEAVRAAALSDQPWERLDELVRDELAAGRTTWQLYSQLRAVAGEVRDTPGLSEDGEDAVGDTLDALIGNCSPRYRYADPPNVTIPSEEEIAKLPDEAQIAFIARCARRELPLFQHHWPQAPKQFVSALDEVVRKVERSASGHSITVDADIAYVVEGVATSNGIATPGLGAVQAVIQAVRALEIEKRLDAINTALRASDLNQTRTAIRRDFDHLSRLALWKKWTDDTPVPPDVFGPLWPEGPPDGWPADPDATSHSGVPVMLDAQAGVSVPLAADVALELFDAVNAYYIARAADRLEHEGDILTRVTGSVPATV